MDTSMGSTIEKIKLQEQGKEVILREKRSIEATMASVKRNLNETTCRVAKIREEIQEATARADALEAELSIEDVRRRGLAALLEAAVTQLRQFRVESEQGISKVWELRNVLCNKVQKVSDQCDVWALFTKPKNILESTVTAKKWLNENTTQICQNQGVLERAQRKRQGLLAERDRLLNEPDSGEEFVSKKPMSALILQPDLRLNRRRAFVSGTAAVFARYIRSSLPLEHESWHSSHTIKNALRYSLEMATQNMRD